MFRECRGEKLRRPTLEAERALFGEGYGGCALGTRDVAASGGPWEFGRRLADRVSRALSEAPAAGERPLRIEVPVEPVEALRWLRSQSLTPRLYWSGREDGVEVAAAGAADLREGRFPGERLALLRDPSVPNLRYYGGLRFDRSREADGRWDAFGSYRFLLPRFELRSSSGVSTLACNLVLPRDLERRGEILEQIEGLRPPRDGSGTLPAPISRVDSPGWAGWRRNVEEALATFTRGRMQKVVLARRAELGFERALDPVLLAERLKTATPGCFHFYVEPEEGVAFLGASPERLFRREGRRVLSEAVAGTRPRSDSAAADAELREELLASEKDLSEHSYVRASIEETLRPLCQTLEVDRTTSEMRLARGRHLVSGVRGALREGVTDAEVLAALHPTPAVGGSPRREAVAAIRELEPFDRGWYAGPVGWIGADGAEFAVGIRSGLVRGSSLSLFSGAGIVPGSTPEGEWAEIEQKIGDFTRIFGLGPHGNGAG
jgi:menaquinone-specific isochorismate synthase